MGGWLGQLWIWIALVLLMVVAGAMTPLVAARLNVDPHRGRHARDQPVQPKAARAPPAEDRSASFAGSSPPGTRCRRPSRASARFLVILWLMLFKPF